MTCFSSCPPCPGCEERDRRIRELEDDLQRIRIVATAGNPMSPKKAALCMSQIDEIARVVLALSPPSPETAPADRTNTPHPCDAPVHEASALDTGDHSLCPVADSASPETKDKDR